MVDPHTINFCNGGGGGKDCSPFIHSKYRMSNFNMNPYFIPNQLLFAAFHTIHKLEQPNFDRFSVYHNFLSL